MKKKLFSLLFILLIFILTSCDKGTNDKDIVILCTTDVHCGIEAAETTMGYTNVSAYRNEMAKDNYVALVDAGDYIQGEYIGAVSKGSSLIDIMNEMNYDAITIGNHEFDYGLDQLNHLLNSFNGDVISCNVKYTGNNKNKLDMVKPYVIKKYGNYNVGFVGVTTPYSITKSTPIYFMEDGSFVYNFSGDTKEDFYKCVQENVNACKKLGADYVILLSHLGYAENDSCSSNNLIKNINGVSAILDGHTHQDINWEKVIDKDGKEVRICQSGYKLNEFGKLIIKKDGSLDYDFIKNYKAEDEKITTYVNSVKFKNEELAKTVLATNNIDLYMTDSDGIRLVRNRETAIGNLIADSYRSATGADIASVNGGGIRANLASGDVTFEDIMAVHPFGNIVCVVEATGQEILDYLEYSSRFVQKDYVKDGKAVGESGGFANVSGLKYTIDTSIETSVELDQNKMFSKITGARRVKDVYVLENGTYVPLDLNKTYKFASHNYLIQNGGDGANMFMDNEALPFSSKYDYEVLVDYIANVLKGNLKDKYSNVEGRINIM